MVLSTRRYRQLMLIDTTRSSCIAETILEKIFENISSIPLRIPLKYRISHELLDRSFAIDGTAARSFAIWKPGLHYRRYPFVVESTETETFIVIGHIFMFLHCGEFFVLFFFLYSFILINFFCALWFPPLSHSFIDSCRAADVHTTCKKLIINSTVAGLFEWRRTRTLSRARTQTHATKAHKRGDSWHVNVAKWYTSSSRSCTRDWCRWWG